MLKWLQQSVTDSICHYLHDCKVLNTVAHFCFGTVFGSFCNSLVTVQSPLAKWCEGGFLAFHLPHCLCVLISASSGKGTIKQL